MGILQKRIIGNNNKKYINKRHVGGRIVTVLHPYYPLARAIAMVVTIFAFFFFLHNLAFQSISSIIINSNTHDIYYYNTCLNYLSIITHNIITQQLLTTAHRPLSPWGSVRVGASLAEKVLSSDKRRGRDHV